MPDAFDELSKFNETERAKAFRSMMGASLSFNIQPSQKPDPVELFMSSYLKVHMERFRDLTNNTLRGFVISTPQNQADTLMLGITYLDKKTNILDEDLWEATHGGLSRMRKTEAEQKYPEYKGYHHEAKKYFGHPFVRWYILTRDFICRTFKMIWMDIRGIYSK